MVIRQATPSEARSLPAQLAGSAGGAPFVVRNGEVKVIAELELHVAEHDGELVGAVGWEHVGDELEVVVIEAFTRHHGVGTAMLAAAIDEARRRECRRLWLRTTNDNVDALRFYQRQGLRLVVIDRGAVDRARVIKPAIPAVGSYGIAMRDELELELLLGR